MLFMLSKGATQAELEITGQFCHLPDKNVFRKRKRISVNIKRLSFRKFLLFRFLGLIWQVSGRSARTLVAARQLSLPQFRDLRSNVPKYSCI